LRRSPALTISENGVDGGEGDDTHSSTYEGPDRDESEEEDFGSSVVDQDTMMEDEDMDENDVASEIARLRSISSAHLTLTTLTYI